MRDEKSKLSTAEGARILGNASDTSNEDIRPDVSSSAVPKLREKQKTLGVLQLSSDQLLGELPDYYSLFGQSNQQVEGLKNNELQHYLAIDERTQQRVVIQLLPKSAVSGTSLQLFESYEQKLSKVRISQYLRPLAWGVTDSFVFNVRLSLKSAVAVPQALGILEVLQYSSDILRCIVELHENNCLQKHFFSNQFLEQDGRGFLACPSPLIYASPKYFQPESALEFAETASPELCGSIEYDVGPSSDLYSFGVFVFRMLCGQPPFTGPDVNSVLTQQMTRSVDWEQLTGVPECVVSFLKHLLKKDPQERYQSSHAVAEDLSTLIELVRSNNVDQQFIPGRTDNRRQLVEPSFIGRQDERKQMSEFVDSRDSSDSKIFVISESGMGKSRFVFEALRGAAQKDLNVFTSNVKDNAGEHPMAPLRAIANQVISNKSILARLEKNLEPYVVEIEEVLPALAQAFSIKSNKAARGGPEALGVRRVAAAIGEFLANIGSQDQPAIVWIDDCQWLDPQVIDVLAEIGTKSESHTKFVLSLREENSKEHDLVRLKSSSPVIHLKPMVPSEIAALTESMAGVIPTIAIRMVEVLAAGSPFMASAVLRGLVETGALHYDDNEWSVDVSRFESVGASVDAAAILATRIKKLPDSAKDVLIVAAIHGREFEFESVVSAGEFDRELADSDLLVLRNLRLVWQRPNNSFAFIHDKIREAVLDRVSEERRQKIHLKIANSLAQADRKLPHKIAYHFDGAGQPELAFPHAVEAAREAQQQFSLTAAIDLYRMAWRGATRNPDQHYKILLNLADTLMLAGNYQESKKWFLNAKDKTESLVDEARITMKLGELAFKTGDKKGAVSLIEEALELLGQPVAKPGIGFYGRLVNEVIVQALHTIFPSRFLAKKSDAPADQRLVWKLYSELAHGYWYTRSKLHVVWAHLRGMNRAEVYSPTPELAQAYSEHAPAMSLVPWRSRGEEYANRSLKIRESQDDLWGQGQSQGFHSILLYACSDFETCISKAGSGEAILKRTGDVWEMNIARYQKAASFYRLGDFNRAIEISKQTYALAMEVGDFQSTANIIDIWARASSAPLPIEVLTLEKSRQIADSQAQCQVLLAVGVSCFRDRDFQGAIDNFEDAIALAKRDSVVNTYTSPIFSWLATAKRKHLKSQPPLSRQELFGQHRQILSAARKAVFVARRFKNDLPHALRELAYAQGMMGRKRRAKTAILKSIEVARDQSAVHELHLSLRAFLALADELKWAKVVVNSIQAELLSDQFQAFENPVDPNDKVSISLVEQFSFLILAGRQIFSELDPSTILSRTAELSQNLLRGQHVYILRPDSQADGWICDNDEANFDRALARQANSERKTVVQRQESDGNHSGYKGTYLCSPIIAGDKVEALLYVANEFVKDCYGENEIQIAEFLTNAAGSALEKSASFQQLDELNRNLEAKVNERTAKLETRTKELEISARELQDAQASLIKSRNEAENANQIKSDFLARMSHEIRTPISAVMGFAELMLRGIVVDPADCREKLGTIHSSGKHLLSLVNDLLDISKIEADKLEFEEIECVPAKIVHDTHQALASKATEKGIGMQLVFEDAIPETILSDPTRLTQAFTNLLGNAIKFTDQGNVTFSVRQCRLENGRGLEFEIKDTGLGVTPEQLTKIFDPFVQADSSTTRKFGGTGLGLSITKQLVELMGGQIVATSEPNVGSAFVVRLPVREQDWINLVQPDRVKELISEQKPQDWKQASLIGKQVLIVDDAATNQQLLEYILADSGATTMIAGNGQEAIDVISERDDLDLVLMDMQMPIMDGTTATRVLRENGCTLPIIALTANTMKGDAEKCLAAGCTSYLSKPIDTNRLMEIISDLLSVQVEETIREFEPETFETGGTDSISEPVDWKSALPDDEPYHSLGKMFIEKLASKLPELHQAVDSEDMPAMKSLAHWMKGSGGSVGFPQITEWSAEIEGYLKSDEWTRVYESINLISRFVAPENQISASGVGC
jgi:two-component system sensor kinase